jgi:hypothetical protein
MKSILMTVFAAGCFSTLAYAREISCSMDSQFVNGDYPGSITFDIGNSKSAHVHNGAQSYFWHVGPSGEGYAFALLPDSSPHLRGLVAAQYRCAVISQ